MLGAMKLLLTALIVLAAALPAVSFAQIQVTETLLTVDSAVGVLPNLLDCRPAV